MTRTCLLLPVYIFDFSPGFSGLSPVGSGWGNQWTVLLGSVAYHRMEVGGQISGPSSWLEWLITGWKWVVKSVDRPPGSSGLSPDIEVGGGII